MWTPLSMSYVQNSRSGCKYMSSFWTLMETLKIFRISFKKANSTSNRLTVTSNRKGRKAFNQFNLHPANNPNRNIVGHLVCQYAYSSLYCERFPQSSSQPPANFRLGHLLYQTSARRVQNSFTSIYSFMANAPIQHNTIQTTWCLWLSSGWAQPAAVLSVLSRRTQPLTRQTQKETVNFRSRHKQKRRNGPSVRFIGGREWCWANIRRNRSVGVRTLALLAAGRPSLLTDVGGSFGFLPLSAVGGELCEYLQRQRKSEMRKDILRRKRVGCRWCMGVCRGGGFLGSNSLSPCDKSLKMHKNIPQIKATHHHKIQKSQNCFVITHLRWWQVFQNCRKLETLHWVIFRYPDHSARLCHSSTKTQKVWTCRGNVQLTESHTMHYMQD